MQEPTEKPLKVNVNLHLGFALLQNHVAHNSTPLPPCASVSEKPSHHDSVWWLTAAEKLWRNILLIFPTPLH